MNQPTQRPQHILIIDDEEKLLHVLGLILREQGYQIHEANSGRTGLQEAVRVKPDLIILDLVMPDISGAEVVTSLRQWSDTPILMLSSSESPAEKVKTLDAGADDFITKPFDPDELLARIRAMLRRNSKNRDEAQSTMGDLQLDYAQRTLTIKNKDIPLSRTEFALLELFSKNFGKLLSHERILQEIWGAEADSRREYLRVYVSSLRRKMTIPEANIPKIETRPSIGYRLTMD
jgi:two-component system KDP operon response regulator KdpE